MNLFLHLYLVGLLCVGSLFADDQAMYTTAQQLLKTIQTSHYDHHGQIDEAKGIYILDCSIFVGLLVGKVSHEALTSLPIDAPHKRARAKNFYDYLHALKPFEKRGGWMGIESLDALEKGDVIAWKYDPSLGKKDTGHVVIVYEKPVLESDERYKIRVLDASKGRHADDSRDETHNGIGTGTMWFRGDATQKPIGLYWSDRSRTMSEHRIALGRVVAP